MQRYPEKSSIISYLFCAVITTLEAKSKLNGWKIRSMTNNGCVYETLGIAGNVLSTDTNADAGENT